MSGLLHKAITIHSQGKLDGVAQTHEPQQQKPDRQDDAQITDQIHQQAAGNPVEVSPRILSNIARYHGALMPLFAFAILCVAAIAFLVISHFLDGQERIRLQKGAYSGQEKQVLDQLTAGYGRALEGLASLRNLLDDPSAASLPAIQRRRGVELFLIGSLEELVKDRQARTEKSRDTRSIEEAASRLRQASVFYQAGNFEAAIDRYEQSLGLLLRDKALARQFTDSLTKAGYRVLAEDELTELSRLRTIAHQRQDLSARLRDIRAQYKAYAAPLPKSSAGDPSSPQSLATLLQTKILLRQVLDAEPVISQYPDLAAKTERYFDTVTAKARDDGRKEALDVLDSLLGELQSGDKTSLPGLAQISGNGELDPLLRLMDRLQAMLQ